MAYEPSPSLCDQINTLYQSYQRVQDHNGMGRIGLPPPRGHEPPGHSGGPSSPLPLRLRPNALPMTDLTPKGTPTRQRKPLVLPVSSYSPKEPNAEMDKKLQEIVKLTGILEIDNKKYTCDIKDLEHVGELGSGTCGLVVKMIHKPSQVVIAVKQMRRSGNSEENKRIIMDLDVVLKSHDCPYIVKCLGCFITESDVWICMELMSTCFDKLLKRHHISIPEDILAKVTLATVRALDYLKEKHGVIHRDVKPSNILLDEKGNVKLCDFGISGRLVDSKAQTASAGCAAYLAPERIAPTNPLKPDYDIRADVWSLGITLIELATGVFPYRQCSSDFQVLAEIVTKEPPTLPPDHAFSPHFRSFVTACLTKNYRDRPKYKKLLEHAFIKRAEASTVDVGAWFRLTSPSPVVSRREVPQSSAKRQSPPQQTFTFKSTRVPDSKQTYFSDSSYCDNLARPNHRSVWQSKYPCEPIDVGTERSLRSSRLSHSPVAGLVAKHEGRLGGALSEPAVVSSDSAACGSSNHTPQLPLSGCNTAALHRFWTAQTTSSHQLNSYNDAPLGRKPELCRAVVRTLSPASHIVHSNVSPAVRRAVFTTVPPDPPEQNAYSYTSIGPTIYSSTVYSSYSSPVPETNHSGPMGDGNKRYSSYLKFNCGVAREESEQGGLSSRPPRHTSPGQPSSLSPEPPPRLGRFKQRGDELSPLPQRRPLADNFPARRLEASPSLVRRLVSPSPPLPLPPPRRTVECNSVPGSPQHHRVEKFRARLHYTPEPQRRVYDAGPHF